MADYLSESVNKNKPMVPGTFQIAKKSVKFYHKQVIYQIIIIALLSAVITGSLLTGRSVKTSLKKTAYERLGNTGIMITSGVRYFDASLSERLKESEKVNCTGLLAIDGFCQSMISQKAALKTNIYAVDHDFFTFHGNGHVNIKPGEVALNSRLASHLNVEPGDEIIIRFNAISDIPRDAPFAPAKESGKSVVMKVGSILEPGSNGNFSLSISQIMPLNIFMNLSELNDDFSDNTEKINRLLVQGGGEYSIDHIYSCLRNVLKPSDIGLIFRAIRKTDQVEMISDRVFIDETITKEIRSIIPASAPVITYLCNRFKTPAKSTPYSFISALPPTLYPEIVQGDSIIINRWLADDLGVSYGDSLELFWYSPDLLNSLIENSSTFIISKIADFKGIWSDSLLMPEFPGIAGSESCSDWDAGIHIKLDDIRLKDEDYWNNYRGTPKAFISYEKGKEMWGNNFGPATAIRFPGGTTTKNIEDKISGSLDPYKTGFIITDISGESIKAASESVDFSTLFMSLGFFLISASVVLLSLSVTSYFSSKKGQIKTLYALGFRNRWIEQLLSLEAGLIVLTGCLTGAIAGNLINILITKGLNSVWIGAVQTDTLEAYFKLMPMLTGFLITFIFTFVFLMTKIKRFLSKLNQKEKEIHAPYYSGRNLVFLLVSSCSVIGLLFIQIYYKKHEIAFSFAAGTFLLLTLILFWRHIFIRRDYQFSANKISGSYYSFYPSHAVTPIIFIATGIFAVFITGANRMNFNEQQLNPSGGTGGYLLWCESAIPIKEDLNSSSGKKVSGLDIEELINMSFVQAKKTSGDDASCLNLNHIAAPPLLGIDPSEFISRGSFSFAKTISEETFKNPWHFLKLTSENNTIYGIADQTVLQWGLKIKPGDTLVLRAENGQPLNIIIAAGLNSSVFQGYVIVGIENFVKYFPSVSGTSVMLVDGESKMTDFYKSTFNERFENYGINTELTTDRLASFYEVTNTYLSVFGVFGVLGMVTGIAGLGFVLLRNYNYRKREFALMMAIGFSIRKIRRIIFSEQVLILFAGVTSGVFSAFTATLPSLKNNQDVPWLFMICMVSAILITGLIVLFFSTNTVTNNSLTDSLKKE